MSYTQKNLNNIHLNRPALVTVKKPLASNEEMSQELIKLLDGVVPMKTKKWEQLKSGGGRYKAIYYNPYYNATYALGYNQNLYFHSFQGFDDTNACSTLEPNMEYVESRYPVITLRDRIKDIPTGPKNPFLRAIVDNMIVAPTYYGYQWIKWFSKFKKTSKSAIEKQKEIDKRTWYVFVLDSNYYIPTLTDNKYGENVYTEDLGGSETQIPSVTDIGVEDHFSPSSTIKKQQARSRYNLDRNVIYKVEEISFSKTTPLSYLKGNQFLGLKNTKCGKILFSKNVSITRAYQVILQESTDCVTPDIRTKKQIEDRYAEYNKHYNGKKYVKYLSDLQSLVKKVNSDYSSVKKPVGFIETPIVNNTKYDGLVKSWNAELKTVYIAVSDLLKDYLKDDLISKISSGKTTNLIATDYAEWETETVDYTNKISGIEYSIIQGKPSIIFPSNSPFSSVFNAYVTMVDRVNREYNAAKVDSSDYRPDVGFECPLRLISQDRNLMSGDTSRDYLSTGSLYGTISGSSSITKAESSNRPVETAVQYQAAINSYGGSTAGNTNLATFTHEYRDIISSSVDMIDFKLMYYMMIKFDVVLPKYLKLLDDFLTGNKFSPVKMYPMDFFDATNSLEYGDVGEFGEKNATNVPDKFGKEDIQTYDLPPILSYDTITQLPLETKNKLLNIYENAYFGGWSGFYYTSSTPNNETISKYANTVIATTLKGINDVSLSLDGIANKDVETIALSRQTMGKSTATVVLNDIDNKYAYKTGIYKGECLFEPLDEVSIYLPNLDGTISQSFVGYISSVNQVNQNGYHSISLMCECPIKLLDIVRTNIKPSMDQSESGYSSVHPFTVPWDMLKTIEKWAPLMLAQGLTYMTSMLGSSKGKVYSIITENGKKGRDSFSIQSPYFEDSLIGYLWFRRSKNFRDQEKASTYLTKLLNEYVNTRKYVNGQSCVDSEEVKGIVPISSILNTNASSNNNRYVRSSYTIYRQRGDNDYFNKSREVSAQLTGTMQPAFALGYSDIPLVFSDYKTNTEILLETAEKFNFFYYSDRSGVVRFCPPQVDLSNLNVIDGKFITDRVFKNNDYSYDYSSPDILSDQTITTLTEEVDDSKLVNWIQLSGSWAESQSIDGITTGNVATIQDIPSIVRYGVHSQRQQTILGISNDKALRIYGTALMDRQNKNFRSASVESVGRGDTDLNRTVFCANNNTIYLRTGLSQNYRAGRSFTSQETLNWGRKPLFGVKSIFSLGNTLESLIAKPVFKHTTNKLDIGLSGLMAYKPSTFSGTTLDKDDTQTKLDKLFNNNKITATYYNQLSSILNALSSNDKLNTLVPTFVFNGYLWEGVSSISFEDLSLSFMDSVISSGFQTALSVIKTAQKDAYFSNMSKVLDLEKETINKKYLNLMSNFTSTFNVATKDEFMRIYTGTNQYVSTGNTD